MLVSLLQVCEDRSMLSEVVVIRSTSRQRNIYNHCSQRKNIWILTLWENPHGGVPSKITLMRKLENVASRGKNWTELNWTGSFSRVRFSSGDELRWPATAVAGSWQPATAIGSRRSSSIDSHCDNWPIHENEEPASTANFVAESSPVLCTAGNRTEMNSSVEFSFTLCIGLHYTATQPSDNEPTISHRRSARSARRSKSRPASQFILRRI